MSPMEESLVAHYWYVELSELRGFDSKCGGRGHEEFDTFIGFEYPLRCRILKCLFNVSFRYFVGKSCFLQPKSRVLHYLFFLFIIFLSWSPYFSLFACCYYLLFAFSFLVI